MSAFLVTPEHLDYIAHAAERAARRNGGGFTYRHAGKRLEVESLDALRLMLYRQNIESVVARYGERDRPETDELPTMRWPAKFDVVQAIKAIHCYEYQACETDDWNTSEARSFCKALERELVTMLQGYDSAAWAISGREEPPTVGPTT